MSTRTGVTPINQQMLSLVDRVTHTVMQSIVDGRLRPGETLSISDLATDLGVSHSPVREALQRLAGQGLVQLRPARTAVVAPLDLHDLHEIYRLRVLNEVDVAVRAAPLLTDADLEGLERHFELFQHAPLDSDAFWTNHEAFHLLLLRPVAAGRFERLITQLWQAAERYIRLGYSETDLFEQRSSYERHHPLLVAARTRDGDAVGAALTNHLRANEDELAKKFARFAGADEPAP